MGPNVILYACLLEVLNNFVQAPDNFVCMLLVFSYTGTDGKLLAVKWRRGH